MSEIHQLEIVTLGNCKQYISTHTDNDENPLLLMLHGGPGTAQIGYIRHFTQSLEQAFIVVNWDQRGSGKSYKFKPNAATMTIEQFVQDAIELIQYLLKTHNKEKIYLVGHSWGTVLGLELTQRIPELIQAYVAVSQVVNMEQSEKISYQFALDKAIERRNVPATNDLKRIGAPPYQTFKDTLKKGEWLTALGGSTYEMDLKKAMQKASSLKEYNIWDWVYRFAKGVYFSVEHLEKELMTVKFDTQIKEIAVPIWFFIGTSDYQVPFILAEKYYSQLRTNQKFMVRFSKCGHMIPFERPTKFCEEILKVKAQIERELTPQYKSTF
jgi:pimeloyl-ACP methyl ester carboxylesterase